MKKRSLLAIISFLIGIAIVSIGYAELCPTNKDQTGWMSNHSPFITKNNLKSATIKPEGIYCYYPSPYHPKIGGKTVKYGSYKPQPHSPWVQSQEDYTCQGAGIGSCPFQQK